MSGLSTKYLLKKADGGSVDPEGIYFVLKLNSRNETNRRASISAARVYALEISKTNPELAVGILETCNLELLKGERYEKDRPETQSEMGEKNTEESRRAGESDARNEGDNGTPSGVCSVNPKECFDRQAGKVDDTDRLEFLMKFFYVDDVGDEQFCPGMLVDTDAVTDAFDRGPLASERVTLCEGWVNPDMRRVIDKAIVFSAKPKSEEIK